MNNPLTSHGRKDACVFAALFALLVLINIPLLVNLVIPQHDTMYMFQAFYFFYNEFFFHNELPQWVPFGFYGVQSDYFLVTLLSPSAYFTGLVGWLLSVKDALFLFNLSLFLEQLIYLFGAWLLARKLFDRAGTVFFVCLTAICSTVLLYQFNQNFHIYNFLPLEIYLLSEFFSKKRTTYLAAGMLVFLASLPGNSAYFFPVMFLPLVIITPALFIEAFRVRRGFLSVPGRDLVTGGLLLLVFVLISGVYYYFNINALEHTEGIFIGRDPVTMATDLETFLTYSGYTIGLEKFSALVLPGKWSIISDITLHVGLLPPVFALYAIAFVRRPLFYAFGLAAVIFALFSLGGATPVAELLYNYFPTMKYYRHIGNSAASLKFFLPFMAGFGVEHLLRRLSPARDDMARTSNGGAGLNVFAAWGIIAVPVMAGTLVYARVSLPDIIAPALAVTALFLLAVFLPLRSIGHGRGLPVFLGACAVFQMLSYQGVVNQFFHLLSKKTGPLQESSIMVNRYGFQESRTLLPQGRRSMETLPLVVLGTVRYTLAYNFLQWDPCASTFRTDFINADAARLLSLRGGGLGLLGDQAAGKNLRLPDDWRFLLSIGCFSPKLRLFSDAVFQDTLEGSMDLIRRTSAIDRALVLNGVPGKDRSLWRRDKKGGGGGGTGTIEVQGFRANGLTLKATIPGDKGAWLYYADAFHPGWKAYVNDREVTVARANIAFKAVRLEGGINSVRLVFDNRRSRISGDVLIVFGMLMISGMLAAMAFSLHRAIKQGLSP